MHLTAADHIVLVSPDPERLTAWYCHHLGLETERLDEWRRGEVPFVSLRRQTRHDPNSEPEATSPVEPG